MTKLGITLPLLNNTIAKIADLAKSAEDAGFDTAFDYQYCRNAFMGLSQASLQTSRIQLGTGLATIMTRTPFETANLIADVDEMSNGRAILGIGLGTPQFMTHFHGAPPTRPLRRMREYVSQIRASWEYMTTGEPVTLKGELYTIDIPPGMPWGLRPMARPQIPIYVAALGPKMLSLCGEIADGVLGALYPLDYLKNVVHASVAAGAKKAGRNPSEIDIASETVCSVHPDRAEAFRRARIQCGMYAALPEVGPLVDAYGLEKDRLEVLDTIMTKGPHALVDVTSDALVDLLSITGTPDEARAKFAEYAEVLPHVLLHAPYAPPLSAEETEDGCRQIFTAFGR